MLSFLSNNWWVLAGFAAAMIQIGRYQGRVGSQGEALKSLQKDYDDTIGKLRDDITQIKEDVAFIRGRLVREVRRDGRGV